MEFRRVLFRSVSLGARDTVLVLSDPRTLSPEDVDGLLAWVEGGGHLLVRTPPLERGADTRTGALFDVLRLRMVPSHECMRFEESSAGAWPGGEKHPPPWSVFCERQGDV